MRKAIAILDKKREELNAALERLLGRCVMPANSSYPGSPESKCTPYVGHPLHAAYAAIRDETLELELAISLLVGMKSSLHKLWEDTYGAGLAAASRQSGDPPSEDRKNPFR